MMIAMLVLNNIDNGNRSCLFCPRRENVESLLGGGGGGYMEEM